MPRASRRIRRSRAASPAKASLPNDRPLVAAWILGTAVAATVERWWFPRAWDEATLAASRFYFGDARAFLGYTEALLRGQTFDNGIPFHPPGWPMALSLLLRILGWTPYETLDPLTIKHINAVISGASVGAAAWLAYCLGGRPAMALTSLLGTFHFGHLVQAAAPNSEPLYGLLMTAVLLQALRWTEGSWVAPLTTGFFAGLATLVRAEFALCVLLIPIIDFLQRGRIAVRVLPWCALGFVIVLTPTTAINWKAIDEFNRTRVGRMPGPLPRFAPVTSYGPFNFANANHSEATGGFTFELPAPETDRVMADELSEAGALDLSRPAVYRAYVGGFRMGTEWMLANPADAARLIGAKLAITLSVFDFGYLQDNATVGVSGLRRPVDQIDPGFSWFTVLHSSLAAYGLVLVARQWPSAALLAPVVTMLVSSATFYGYVRLGVAHLPVIWVLQSLALIRLLALTGLGGIARRAIVLAAVSGIVLLIYEVSGSRDRRVLLLDGLVDDAGVMVEDQPVTIERVR